MSRTGLYKFLILAATAAACGVAVWWKLHAGASPAAVVPAHDDAPAAVGVSASTGDGDGALLSPAGMTSSVLDEEAAKALFRGVREGARQMYDPLAYAVLRPNVTQTWPWPEHPDGKIVSRTNNMGFRRDTPTAEAKSGPRILVVGDSQTDGMVNNSESFCTLLEGRLNAAFNGASGVSGDSGSKAMAVGGAMGRVEVLNAGVGNTGPHNYLGSVKRNLHLKPDVCIAVLFTGNDFLNALVLSDFFTKREASKPSGAAGESYQRLMLDAYKQYGAIVVDRFNQALKFTRFPEDAELGLQVSIDCFLQMQELCTKQGIPFLAVILPTKPDVDRDDREAVADVLKACALTDEQFGINAELGRRFAAALRAKGVSVLDTTDALRAAGDTPHYWKKDWHLNPAGHALVAGLLQEAVEALLASTR